MKSTGGRNIRKIFGPPQGRSSTARDEDLVLFRELHKREKDRIASLLLPVSDEFELTGANNTHNNPALFRIPSNKKSSSGLESLSGAEKNDYDWLKTPPATPLFPSLEMEAATAPEMAVQRELPIMQPLSRFSSNFLQGPRLEADPSPKTPTTTTNKPKPSPTPVVTSTTSKPNNKPSIHHSTPRHPDPFLTSNLSKPDPKPKPESASRPKSRGSVSPSVRAMIKGVSDHTPANLKIDKRSLSSTRGGRAVGLTPNVKPADPRPLSVTRSRTAVSGGGAAATTPFGASDQRRQSCSPSVRRTEGIVKERRVDGGGGMATQSFFGSKMVDKVMSARKKGGGDAAAKTSERLGRRGSAPGGSGGLGRVLATKSSLDMAVKPTMETKGALSRSSKMVTRAK